VMVVCSYLSPRRNVSEHWDAIGNRFPNHYCFLADDKDGRWIWTMKEIQVTARQFYAYRRAATEGLSIMHGTRETISILYYRCLRWSWSK
jgi:hypothetical protein